MAQPLDGRDGRNLLLENFRPQPALKVPEHRLAARVAAEVAGLPADFVDTYAARVSAVSAAEVNAAIKRHVHARDLAITMVASAPVMKKLLTGAKIQESAIDVVPYDGF